VRRGVRLGVDVGSVRIGVARCDPDGILATPVETVDRRGRGAGLPRITQLVEECGALEVVIGLPTGLAGTEGPAAATARGYAQAVAGAVNPVPVRLVDERFTTVQAHRSLREAGVGGRRRRGVVDQAAAVLILQAALDAERASGRPAGSVVVPEPGGDGEPDGPVLGEDG
jgi:putative holliday junction resolvase